jgi:hypothetical protein
MLKRIIKFIEEETETKDLSVKSKEGNLAVFRGIYYKVARDSTTYGQQIIADEIKQSHAMCVYWNKNLENIIEYDYALKELYKKVNDKFKPKSPNKVIIESPYAGQVGRNVKYANICLRDSLMRGEYPMASHLLYTKALDDRKPKERDLGIRAGLFWGLEADKTIVYTDYGISDGMKIGIEAANGADREIIYRTIENLEL